MTLKRCKVPITISIILTAVIFSHSDGFFVMGFPMLPYMMRSGKTITSKTLSDGVGFDDHNDMHVVFHPSTDNVSVYYAKAFKDRYTLTLSHETLNIHQFLGRIDANDFVKFQGWVMPVDQARADKTIVFRWQLPQGKSVKIMKLPTMQQRSRCMFYGMDVTQRVPGSTGALENLIEEQAILYNNADELIVKLDKDGNVEDVSQTTLDVYGLKEKDVIGRNAFKINETVRRWNHDWFTKTKEHHHAHSEATITTHGKTKHIRWTHQALINPLSGEIRGVLSLGREMTDYLHINEQLRFEKNHDSLTNVLNDRGLFEHLRTLKSHLLGAAFVTLNGYDQVHDYYGHSISDKVMKQFTQNLKDHLPDFCLLARYSSSAYVILCMREEESLDLYKVLHSALNPIRIYTYADETLSITLNLNVGLAHYPEDTQDVSYLISHASLASSAAKKSPFDFMRQFTSRMSDTLENNVLIATRLREAMETRSIASHFQPVINTQTQEIAYVEALARWDDEMLGSVAPDIFLNIAEQSSLISALEPYLLKQALRRFKEINFHKDTVLALNLSSESVLNPDIGENLLTWAHALDIAPHEIVLEVSENTFMDNVEKSIRHIEHFKTLGFKVAIDDFGKEYSSLGILKYVPYDIIKIDQMFTQSIEDNDTQEIISMVKRITMQNNAKLIIEGVETSEQASILKRLGCYLHQGYYHGRPNSY